MKQAVYLELLVFFLLAVPLSHKYLILPDLVLYYTDASENCSYVNSESFTVPYGERSWACLGTQVKNVRKCIVEKKQVCVEQNKYSGTASIVSTLA